MEEVKTTEKVEEGVVEVKPTLTELLETDKELQSEFDKLVAKGINTAKSKWEKEAEVIKTEAEKLAKMDADEKLKYELEKERTEKETYQKKLNAYELEKEATKLASEKGIPLELTKVINFETASAESINDILNSIETTYKQAVEKGVNDVMKERTPKTIVESSSSTETKPRASF